MPELNERNQSIELLGLEKSREQAADMYATECWESYMRHKEDEMREEAEPEEERSVGIKKFWKKIKSTPRIIKNGFERDYLNAIKDIRTLQFREYFLAQFYGAESTMPKELLEIADEADDFYTKFEILAQENKAASQEQKDEDLYLDNQISEVEFGNDVNGALIGLAHDINSKKEPTTKSVNRAKKAIARELKKTLQDIQSDSSLPREIAGQLANHVTFMMIEQGTSLELVVKEIQKLGKAKLFQLQALQNELAKQPGLFDKGIMKRIMRRKNWVSTGITVAAGVGVGVLGKSLTAGALGALGGIFLGGLARAGITYGSSKKQERGQQALGRMRYAQGEVSDPRSGRADIATLDNLEDFQDKKQRKALAQGIVDRQFEEMDEYPQELHKEKPDSAAESQEEAEVLPNAIDAAKILDALILANDENVPKDKKESAIVMAAGYMAAHQVQYERLSNKKSHTVNCIKFPAGSVPNRFDLQIRKALRSLCEEEGVNFKDLNKRPEFNRFKEDLHNVLGKLDKTVLKYTHEIAFKKTRKDLKNYALFVAGIGAASTIVSLGMENLTEFFTHDTAAPLSGNTQTVLDSVQQQINTAVELSSADYAKYQGILEQALVDGNLSSTDISQLQAAGFTVDTAIGQVPSANVQVAGWYDNLTQAFDKSELDIWVTDGHDGLTVKDAFASSHQPFGPGLPPLDLASAMANDQLKAVVVIGDQSYVFGINPDYSFNIPPQVMSQIGEFTDTGKFISHADKIHFAQMTGDGGFNSIATVLGDGTASPLTQQVITVDPPEISGGFEWQAPNTLILPGFARTPYGPLGKPTHLVPGGRASDQPGGGQDPYGPRPEPFADGPEEEMRPMDDFDLEWRPIPRATEDEGRPWPTFESGQAIDGARLNAAVVNDLNRATEKAKMTHEFGDLAHTKKFKERVLKTARESNELKSSADTWAEEIFADVLSPQIQEGSQYDEDKIKTNVSKLLLEALEASKRQMNAVPQGDTAAERRFLQQEFRSLFTDTSFVPGPKTKLVYALGTPVFILTQSDLHRFQPGCAGVAYQMIRNGKKKRVILIGADASDQISLDTVDHEITHDINATLFPQYEKLDQKNFLTRLSPYVELIEEVTAHLHQPNLDGAEESVRREYITRRLAGEDAIYRFVENSRENILNLRMRSRVQYTTGEISLEDYHRITQYLQDLTEVVRNGQGTFYRDTESIVDVALKISKDYGHKGIMMLQNLELDNWRVFNDGNDVCNQELFSKIIELQRAISAILGEDNIVIPPTPPKPRPEPKPTPVPPEPAPEPTPNNPKRKTSFDKDQSARDTNKMFTGNGNLRYGNLANNESLEIQDFEPGHKMAIYSLSKKVGQLDYRGNEIIFSGKGETIRIAEGTSRTVFIDGDKVQITNGDVLTMIKNPSEEEEE